MKRKIGASIFLFAFCMAFVGCRYALKIEKPLNGPSTTAVSEFRVKLHPNFDPSTFTAKLDGMDLFDPFVSITPGGIATAPGVHFTRGEHKLVVTGRISPSEAGDVTSTESVFTPPPLELSEPAWTSSSLSPTCPAGSTCFVLPNRPPASVIPIQEGETHTVTVFVPSAPPRPLRVEVFTPNSNVVSLNNQSAGMPIILEIPTNDRRTTFTIRGIQQGNFLLKAKAVGYQTDEISWSVR